MDEFVIELVNFQLTQQDFIIRILIAIGSGFLIGLEREHSALNSKQEAFAGTRTFVFLVLLGFLGAMTHFVFTPWIFLGILLSVVSFIAISYYMTSSKGDIGGTTEFSALIAFLLGALIFLGYIELSLMITVVSMVLLSSKGKLQTIIGEITEEEMYALIRFVVLALLILPFLPDEGIGPFGV
ncbi:MAG TPA: MgtC/SapB family protein, partial [Cyclobacteriaceae bacterium]|nr:MgtC/SapB family protein [Cyclobacteriaceae bacterium]